MVPLAYCGMFSYIAFPTSHILGYQPMGWLDDRVKRFIIIWYVETSEHVYIQKCGSHQPITKHEGIKRIEPEMRLTYEEILILSLLAKEKVMHWLMSFSSQKSLWELAMHIYQFLHPGTKLG